MSIDFRKYFIIPSEIVGLDDCRDFTQNYLFSNSITLSHILNNKFKTVNLFTLKY